MKKNIITKAAAAFLTVLGVLSFIFATSESPDGCVTWVNAASLAGMIISAKGLEKLGGLDEKEGEDYE